MDSLTTKEYADLRGCTVQHARKLILEGKLEVEEIHGPGGRDGKSYLIPLIKFLSQSIKTSSPFTREQPYAISPNA